MLPLRLDTGGFCMKKLAILIVIVFCCLLSACSNTVSDIVANCVICADSITLPIKAKEAYRGGDHTSFILAKTLTEIKTDIDGMGAEITSGIFGDDFLLIKKTTADGNVHFYMLAKGKGADTFYFFSPSSELTDGDVILTPFHLLGFTSANLQSGEIYNVKAGEEYKINSTKEAVADFYREACVYEITDEPDSMVIRIKSDLLAKGGHGKKHTRGTFAIDFEDRPDGTYATYRMIEE